MNLIYGKCIRIEDAVDVGQMVCLVDQMNPAGIYEMVLGSQSSRKVWLHSAQVIKFSANSTGRRFILESDWLLFEASFEPCQQGYLMTANLNLYTHEISRDEVISNVLTFTEGLIQRRPLTGKAEEQRIDEEGAGRCWDHKCQFP